MITAGIRDLKNQLPKFIELSKKVGLYLLLTAESLSLFCMTLPTSKLTLDQTSFLLHWLPQVR